MMRYLSGAAGGGRDGAVFLPNEVSALVRPVLAAQGRSDRSGFGLVAEAQARVRLRGLIGEGLPCIHLERFDGAMFGPSEINGEWVAYYFFPGTGEAASLGNCAAADSAQHAAFSAHQDQLMAHGVRTVGISSATPAEMRAVMIAGRISHLMLSDTAFALGDALKLPTFEHQGRRCYRRLTLLARQHIVCWLGFPVDRPEASPRQILTWLKLNA